MLPQKCFDLIYADPPWHFKVRSPKGENRSAKNHYSVMTIDDICALPVNNLASDNAVLLMWVIDPMLPDAMDVINAWGFEFKTVGFYWVKENIKSPGYFTGLGYYTRANPEQCWLATKGNGLERINKDVKRLIVTPRQEHSRKPVEAYSRIERLFGSEISRVELFARTKHPGWSSWGNEVECDIEF
jgi:N6-adenosine-specific RNA methylase IME4